MDPIKQSNDSIPIDFIEGCEIVELNSTALEVQFLKENARNNKLIKVSIPLEAQTIEVRLDSLFTISTCLETQSTEEEESACTEDVQVVNYNASNTPDNGYNHEDILTNIAPLFYDSKNNFVYKGTTYYSYDALVHSHECYVRLNQAMHMDLDTSPTFDTEGPPFSPTILFATGGSPAIINPVNGLPWRKGANLCRPYMDNQCCPYGTACVFDHPWPPTNQFP